ncbi:protein phosphatase methylesterase 1 [Microplitis mediator]|uniref:protein phosphatase methylesterase 1 n=1 Tax=Microplitis mediator TaxID=375433 RepID=UPI0025571EF0|nr:protein phosphatase methylesterase 1 [Microplitis mediator]
MSALQKSVLKSKLPPSGMDFTTTRSCKARALQRKRDYDPIEWTPFFDDSKDVVIGENTFHIYTKGNEGPTLVLLHGGGYSALTWAEFTKSITSMIICRVLALDLRGHGDTHTTDDEDLSGDTLAMDVAAVVKKVTEGNPVILVGHSMGGAVAVRAAEHLDNLTGLTLIDVVEGTAMDALTSMQSFLRSRPTSFSSICQAIEWCVRSGQIRNIESAKVSVPGQIKNNETNKLATHDIKDVLASSIAHSNENLSVSIERDDVIPEDKVGEDDHHDEEEETKEKIDILPTATKDFAEQNKKYSWRINLSKTENHWSGWFKGLSAAFLDVPAPKLLLLAGIDRLDRELTVGQMQGKFQMQVLPACGHAVHEDVPDKVAEAIATFMVRNKFAEPASDFHRVFPAC